MTSAVKSETANLVPSGESAMPHSCCFAPGGAEIGMEDCHCPSVREDTRARVMAAVRAVLEREQHGESSSRLAAAMSETSRRSQCEPLSLIRSLARGLGEGGRSA